MSKTKGLLFTAGIVLAMAFTFSGCKEKEAAANTFTDSRDNKKYKAVKIGEQVWMAENLNFAAEGSKCYENDPANCAKYGRLYDWETAKKACPAGWHLPTNEEWTVLQNVAGGLYTAGAKLKAKTGWNENGNGTDEFGFSALPGGEYGADSSSDDNFYIAGNFGLWWIATEAGSSYHAYFWSMIGEDSGASSGSTSKSSLFSVRCVKDN